MKTPGISQPGRSQVIQAAGIVSIAFVASRLIGFVRDAIIGAYYGATGIEALEANAYRIASRIPEAIFFIIAGGALTSAFLPTFTGYLARKDEEGAWRLFSAVINLIFLTLVVVSVAAAFFARPLLLLYLPEMAQQEALLALTIRLLRVLLLSTAIFGVSGIFMGALHARQQFLLPALAPIIYNLGIIGGAILVQIVPGIAADDRVMGLAWGSVAGAIGHLAVQLPGLYRQGARYFPVFTLRHPGVRQVLRLMAPRVLGLSFSQINILVIPILTQDNLLVVAALDFAWRIVLMPQGILGQALGIAAFPTFASLAARRELPQMRRILADTLRLILFLGMPATILLMALSQPLIAVAFQRGAFDAQDTALTAWALLFYAPGLVALAALEVVSRAFYAMEDTRTPVLAGALQILGMAVLAYLFSQWLFPSLGWPPLGGIALGVSLSNLLETAFLIWLLRRKMHGVDGRHLLDGTWRVTIAAIIMGLAAWAIQQPLGGLAVFWQLVVGGLVGGTVYLAATSLLQLSEVRQILDYTRRRIRRS